MNTIYVLLKREWLVESRQKHALGGIVLYILSTIFVCYLSFDKLSEPESWNALLWIILLFVTTISSNNSFANESGSHHLYTYTLLAPQKLIVGKMIYVSGLNALLCLIAYAVYSLLMGNMINNHLLFFAVIFLGSTGLSIILTMNSAIASKTSGNSAMISILSFPLVLPLLLTVIKLSRLANLMSGVEQSNSLLVVLIALDILIAALVYLLFPYLWRE